MSHFVCEKHEYCHGDLQRNTLYETFRTHLESDKSRHRNRSRIKLPISRSAGPMFVYSNSLCHSREYGDPLLSKRIIFGLPGYIPKDEFLFVLWYVVTNACKQEKQNDKQILTARSRCTLDKIRCYRLILLI